MFRSLRMLTLALIVGLVTVSSVLLIAQQLQMRAMAIEDVTSRAAIHAASVSYHQGELIHNTHQFLERLAQSDTLSLNDPDACSANLADILTLQPDFINIGIPYANGDLLCNALPLPDRRINVSDRRYIQTAMIQKTLSMSEFQRDRVTGKLSMNLAYPIVDTKGEVIALAVAVVSLNGWSESFSRSPLPENAVIYIADADQSLIVTYPQNIDLLGRQSTAVNISAQSLTNLSDIEVMGEDGVERLFHHEVLFTRPDGREITVSVGLPISKLMSEINQKFIASLLVLLLIIVLFGGLLLRFLTIRLLNPIHNLVTATNALKQGEPIPAPSPQQTSAIELHMLQLSFAEMVQSRQFAEGNAQVKQNELETLLKSLPDDYFRVSREGRLLQSRRVKHSKLIVNSNAHSDYVWDSFDQDEVVFAAFIDADKDEPVNTRVEFEQANMFFEARILSIDGLNECIVVVRDLTEHKQREQLIWSQANYDALTDLPNRANLMASLERCIQEAKLKRQAIALLTIDLDNFKDVNDSLGHHHGDYILQCIAERLKGSVREHDIIARLGGDEFTVVLTQLDALNPIEHVRHIAQKLLDVMSRRIDFEEVRTFTSASVGVSMYPENGRSISDLFKMSDQAMYAAKASGRNKCRFFDASMAATAENQMALSSDLHEALEHSQFELYFQPIIDLNSQKIVKAEALIRWRHPEKGMISPVDFIPVAERSHLMSGIGQWVFNDCLNAINKLRDKGFGDLQTTINISPAQIMRDPQSIRQWPQLLEQAGLSSKCIVAEITENLLLTDDEASKQVMQEFRENHIQVAIDDFGTGYSSLSYLMKYGIDYLKIDRSFVGELGANTDAFALCEAITSLAKNLNIKVIAEGIETQSQLEILKTMGCDYGQGYWFSQPLPFDEFVVLLQSQQDQ